jgi:hypothetical protein
MLDQTIRELEAKYGKVFGLRGFPREKFCISRGASYVIHSEQPRVMIYTFRWDKRRNEWLAFSKGTLDECRREFKTIPQTDLPIVPKKGLL